MSSNAGMRRYSGLRPVSAQRETQLRESGLYVPGSTFARKGVHRLPERPTTRHPVPTGPDQATVLLVLKRALRDVPGLGLVSCCEVCGEAVWGSRGYDYSIHHRKGRMGVATDNSPANLLCCCGASNVDGCHGRIHQRASWSRPLGLLLSRVATVDPATAPVCIDRSGRWVLLGADGGYADEPGGVA